MDVYFENALDISIYKPYFRFYGQTLQELALEIKDRLGIDAEAPLTIVFYNMRSGSSGRKQLQALPTGLDAVYVALKVGNDNQ